MMAPTHFDSQIINPIEYKGWDELLLTNPDATIFHTSAWSKVLSDTYRYRPLYFTSIYEGQLVGLFPVMEVKSILTGRRGVSLPFTDECHPIAGNQNQFELLFGRAIEHAKKADWKYVELKGGQKRLNRQVPSGVYAVHRLDLRKRIEELFNNVKGNVKRNIKRARQEGLQVILSETRESMEAFCRLNCMTRRWHGLPPQPILFFRNIFKNIISREKGFVALALHRMRPVAGAVFFHWNDSAIFKYGASDRKFLHLRPNNLIMWEAIRCYVEKGLKVLNFGRSETDNFGLIQFKKSWGADQKYLNYYKYDVKKDRYISTRTGPKSSYMLFRHLPIPLLRLTGNLLYRHVG